jgi:hypothetical protein
MLMVPCAGKRKVVNSAQVEWIVSVLLEASLSIAEQARLAQIGSVRQISETYPIPTNRRLPLPADPGPALQFLPLTAEGDLAPILALDGEALGGDAVLGQVAHNFAEARLLIAPVLPNLLVARPVPPSGKIAVIGSGLMFLVLWSSARQMVTGLGDLVGRVRRRWTRKSERRPHRRSDRERFVV